jgi:hypothetical protein
MANRRISELPLIEGDLVAEEDLFTLVHVYEVDPSLKNKRITVSGLKNYLNNYYLNTSENDLTINGVRVGRGPGAVETNTTVGNGALNANSYGDDNTVIGYEALYSNVLGFANTAVGFKALYSSDSGASNTAVGWQALYSNDNGSANIAIGLNALYSNDGFSNIAIGVNTLYFNNNGNRNIAMGDQAFWQNLDGSFNIVIGDEAFHNNTTGSYNIGIGCGVTSTSTSVSNEVNIYNGVTVARFQGAQTAWTFVSDARDKTNIQDLTIGLDFITTLKPRKFEWNLRHTEIDKGKPAAGFIAQELLETIENFDASYVNLVHTDDPEQFTFAQANLVPVLVNAVKELSAMVKELQAAVLKGV